MKSVVCHDLSNVYNERLCILSYTPVGNVGTIKTVKEDGTASEEYTEVSHFSGCDNEFIREANCVILSKPTQSKRVFCEYETLFPDNYDFWEVVKANN